jgi:hypothetical protein
VRQSLKFRKLSLNPLQKIYAYINLTPLILLNYLNVYYFFLYKTPMTYLFLCKTKWLHILLIFNSAKKLRNTSN